MKYYILYIFTTINHQKNHHQVIFVEPSTRPTPDWSAPGAPPFARVALFARCFRHGKHRSRGQWLDHHRDPTKTRAVPMDQGLRGDSSRSWWNFWWWKLVNLSKFSGRFCQWKLEIGHLFVCLSLVWCVSFSLSLTTWVTYCEVCSDRMSSVLLKNHLDFQVYILHDARKCCFWQTRCLQRKLHVHVLSASHPNLPVTCAGWVDKRILDGSYLNKQLKPDLNHPWQPNAAYHTWGPIKMVILGMASMAADSRPVPAVLSTLKNQPKASLSLPPSFFSCKNFWEANRTIYLYIYIVYIGVCIYIFWSFLQSQVTKSQKSLEKKSSYVS